jgi:hypothetical protein
MEHVPRDPGALADANDKPDERHEDSVQRVECTEELTANSPNMKTLSIKSAANVLCCILAWAALSGTAAAQVTAGPIPGDASALERGQALFTQYIARADASSLQAAQALQEVYANGMPRTAQNCSSLRSLLASKTASEEKIILARLVAKQYAPNDPTGMNHLILQDLKGLTNSEDLTVARAATFAFSRLGYFPDYQDVLLAARNREVIDDDSYYGELAHILAYAPAADQVRLAQVLRSSRNYYASQIVAMIINDAAVGAKISVGSRAELAALLDGVEPRFAMALGQFEFVDAIRYSAWLRAVATSNAPASDRQSAELIMIKLRSYP